LFIVMLETESPVVVICVSSTHGREFNFTVRNLRCNSNFKMPTISFTVLPPLYRTVLI
jgi:hypothetical protein